MASVLEKLLRDADDKPLSGVLPRVVRFGEAAQLTDLAKWAQLELGGYLAENAAMVEDIVVPEYRTVGGRWFDEWNRPLVVEDAEIAALIQQRRLREGIHQLEVIARSTGSVAVRDPDHAGLIHQHLQVDVSLFRFTPSAVDQVLANVRGQLINKLLAVREPVGLAPHGSASQVVEQAGDEIIELRPNFFGFGLNLRAMWRYLTRWRQRRRGTARSAEL